MKKKIEIGQVVYSTMGRDQEQYFVVSGIEDEYVYLIDGKLRRVDKPKRKKLKHIKPTHIVISSIKEKLLKKESFLDAEVRKQLKNILEQNELNG